jgi:peptide/nickel transport system substrate-binding protein
MRGSTLFAAATAAVALVGLTAASGAQAQNVDRDATIVVGTTDQPVSYDPAGSYDNPSWNVIYNVYSFILELPPGETTPSPDAAKSCTWQDPKTYKCTLKSGIKFSNGKTLTSEDVKFSLERVIEQKNPNGPASLLSSLDRVETPDDSTVIFHLRQPDATWPYILTTGAGAIVPSNAYPRDELQPSDEVISSGHYHVAAYRPGVQTVLEANPDYYGEPARNARAIVQYFSNSATLKLAVEQGDVDVGYRKFTPTDIAALRDSERGVRIVEGKGTVIRYLVWNLGLEPGDELAVRKAAAYLMDRPTIAEQVYNGLVTPLYSMVPTVLQGHTDAFKEKYGVGSNPQAARKVLEEAGIDTPVELQLWWTPTHYGDASADEYAEIQRSLETGDIFDVTLKSTEWSQYVSAATTDQYPAFQLGWFPDYPDADNYIAPFYGSETSFLNNHYENERVDELIAKERASTDQQERVAAFEEIQEIVAEEVPIIPYWQGIQLAAAREGVTGVKETLDGTYIFRHWLVGKQM